MSHMPNYGSFIS